MLRMDTEGQDGDNEDIIYQEIEEVGKKQPIDYQREEKISRGKSAQ